MRLSPFSQVIVVGTGLEESIVAAAASRNGHTLLHLDADDYYGAEWAAFSFDGIQEWIQRQKDKQEQEEDEEKKDSEVHRGRLP